MSDEVTQAREGARSALIAAFDRAGITMHHDGTEWPGVVKLQAADHTLDYLDANPDAKAALARHLIVGLPAEVLLDLPAVAQPSPDGRAASSEGGLLRAVEAGHVPYFAAKMTRTTPGASDPAMSGLDTKRWCRRDEEAWPCAAIRAAASPSGDRPQSEHPEATCQRCGRPNPVWHTDNDLWNRIMGSPDNPRAEGVIVCPSCFAEAAGTSVWSFRPQSDLAHPEPVGLREEDVARLFHEAYERLAPSFGYETRKASAVPWEDVPEPNRSLMVAVAGAVRAALAATPSGDLAARIAALSTEGVTR